MDVRGYPGAAALFNQWVLAKGPLRGWERYLKGGVEVLSMPHETYHGILLLFFREQDVFFSSMLSRRSELKVSMHSPGHRGYMKRRYEGQKHMDHARAWTLAFLAAFRLLERRLSSHQDEDIAEPIIGVHLGA